MCSIRIILCLFICKVFVRSCDTTLLYTNCSATTPNKRTLGKILGMICWKAIFLSSCYLILQELLPMKTSAHNHKFGTPMPHWVKGTTCKWTETAGCFFTSFLLLVFFYVADNIIWTELFHLTIYYENLYNTASVSIASSQAFIASS